MITVAMRIVNAMMNVGNLSGPAMIQNVKKNIQIITMNMITKIKFQCPNYLIMKSALSNATMIL